MSFNKKHATHTIERFIRDHGYRIYKGLWSNIKTIRGKDEHGNKSVDEVRNKKELIQFANKIDKLHRNGGSNNEFNVPICK